MTTGRKAKYAPTVLASLSDTLNGLVTFARVTLATLAVTEVVHLIREVEDLRAFGQPAELDVGNLEWVFVKASAGTRVSQLQLAGYCVGLGAQLINDTTRTIDRL